jgi:hypothetical protein
MAVTSWVTSDPAAAASWVESLQDPSLKNHLTLEMAGTWASIDPQAALTYAQTQPDTATRTVTLREVFTSWAQMDGPSLNQWLATQPTGPTTDLAHEQLATTRFAHDPAGAMAAAAAISDENTRQARLESMFAYWNRKSPADARQWLNETPVSPALRPRLEQLTAAPPDTEEE